MPERDKKSLDKGRREDEKGPENRADEDALPNDRADSAELLRSEVLSDERVDERRDSERKRRQTPIQTAGRKRRAHRVFVLPSKENAVGEVHNRDGTGRDDDRRGEPKDFATAARTSEPVAPIRRGEKGDEAPQPALRREFEIRFGRFGHSGKLSLTLVV